MPAIRSVAPRSIHDFDEHTYDKILSSYLTYDDILSSYLSSNPRISVPFGIFNDGNVSLPINLQVISRKINHYPNGEVGSLYGFASMIEHHINSYNKSRGMIPSRQRFEHLGL